MSNFMSIDDMLTSIKDELDGRNHTSAADKKKVSMIYAYNSSGKTRLSKLFHDRFKGKVLYYNAYTEDIFTWDNSEYTLKFDKDISFLKTIDDRKIRHKVTKNFKKFAKSELEPNFDFSEGKITFSTQLEHDTDSKNIKISRGEESAFVWSIFYTLLEATVDSLNKQISQKPTTNFKKFHYAIIDDPVSSMDETRIIAIALELAELITKSKSKLKFLITTHHVLFFNVLFHARKGSWNLNAYTLSKSNSEKYFLKKQEKDSPFAYHHAVIFEIEEAIRNNDLKKYHFNLFRALLEKSANFLGHSGGWKKLLSSDKHGKAFIKTLDHHSHDRLSDLEAKDLPEEQKDNFKKAFSDFLHKFGFKRSNEEQR